MTVIKLPPVPKETWNWTGRIKYADGVSKGKAVMSLADLEPVETPAGSFKSYKITQDFMLENDAATQKATNIQWMAPGVGMVKSETTAGNTIIKVVLTGYSLKKP